MSSLVGRESELEAARDALLRAATLARPDMELAQRRICGGKVRGTSMSGTWTSPQGGGIWSASKTS